MLFRVVIVFVLVVFIYQSYCDDRTKDIIHSCFNIFNGRTEVL